MNDIVSARTSTLDPAGPVAAEIANLTWWMVWGFGSVFVIVMVLLYFAYSRPRREFNPAPPGGDRRFILFGGVVFPAVVVLGLLVVTLLSTRRILAVQEGVRIELTGHMWWWEVNYPGLGIVTANEIYIPAGETVHIELKSNDVIHSLWVPSLAGKMDLIPGHINHLSFSADKAGVFWGQCAEYCGLQHARMSLYVVSVPRPEFDLWVQRKALPPPPPTDDAAVQGRKVFFREGCAECHTIKGVAGGKIGPDLTLLSSRLSLGAGVIANTQGALAGWISNPQALKPGNHMPRSYLKPDELHALVSYLRNLN